MDIKFTPPLRPHIGGRNLCTTCPHYNGERCVKLPFEYCKITKSTT